jgi:hypothetical protein
VQLERLPPPPVHNPEGGAHGQLLLLLLLQREVHGAVEAFSNSQGPLSHPQHDHPLGQQQPLPPADAQLYLLLLLLLLLLLVVVYEALLAAAPLLLAPTCQASLLQEGHQLAGLLDDLLPHQLWSSPLLHLLSPLLLLLLLLVLQLLT